MTLDHKIGTWTQKIATSLSKWSKHIKTVWKKSRAKFIKTHLATECLTTGFRILWMLVSLVLLTMLTMTLAAMSTTTEWIAWTARSIHLIAKYANRRLPSKHSLITWCKNTQPTPSQMLITSTTRAAKRAHTDLTTVSVVRMPIIKAGVAISKRIKTGTTSKQWTSCTTNETKIAMNCTSRIRASTGRGLKSTKTWFSTTRRSTTARSAEYPGALATVIRCRRLTRSSGNITSRLNIMVSLTMPRNEICL